MAEPLSLAAVRADDELLDNLGRREPAPTVTSGIATTSAEPELRRALTALAAHADQGVSVTQASPCPPRHAWTLVARRVATLTVAAAVATLLWFSGLPGQSKATSTLEAAPAGDGMSGHATARPAGSPAPGTATLDSRRWVVPADPLTPLRPSPAAHRD